MKQNPVYRRESRILSRSLKLPVILSVFNGILCSVTLLNMYSVVAQVKSTAAIQYSSFMDIYEFVAAIEFLLLMFIVPAVTSVSISGERERQTLELMLTTQMTPAQIVIGKLMSALGMVVLLIGSSLPAIAMVFVFGGITAADMAALLICYGASALLAGSIGIFFSAVFKRSTLATAASYGLLAVLTAGTYVINRFAMSMAFRQPGPAAAAVYGAESAGSFPSGSGSLVYLLLVNPAATFYSIITSQTGMGGGIDRMFHSFGNMQGSWAADYWIVLSIGLQLAVSAVLLAAAVEFTDPIRGRKKKGHFRRTH